MIEGIRLTRQVVARGFITMVSLVIMPHKVEIIKAKALKVTRLGQSRELFRAPKVQVGLDLTKLYIVVYQVQWVYRFFRLFFLGFGSS